LSSIFLLNVGRSARFVVVLSSALNCERDAGLVTQKPVVGMFSFVLKKKTASSWILGSGRGLHAEERQTQTSLD
jgi:hypothetical protein